MKVVDSTEVFIPTYQNTQHNITEDRCSVLYGSENLKPKEHTTFLIKTV
jgi:hypothetical protein